METDRFKVFAGKKRRLFSAVSLALMTNLAAAQSEQAKPATEEGLEELTVYGLSFESEGILAIGKKEIDEQMVTSINELFRNVPNVEALQGPGRQFFDFNLRGSEGAGSVIVTVDGAEKNLVTTKHGTTFNPVFIVPEFLKSVSIIQGPVSNTFGTGSTGGRVQFETVDPFDYADSDDKFGGELRINGETNGDGRLVTGIFAGSISENLGVLGAFSDRSYDSYHDGDGEEVLNSGSDSENYLAKFQWEPAAGWSVEGSHARSEIEYIGSNIFARSNERQDADFFNDVTDTGTQVSVDYNPGTGFSWFANGFVSTTEHIETLLEGRQGANGDPGDTDSRDVETIGGQTYVAKQFYYGDYKFDLSAGISGSEDTLEFSEDSSDVGGTRANYGVFVQGRIEFSEAFNLVPGLRYERYDIETDIDTDTDGGEWLPKLTANYSIAPGVVAFASYAKGLRAPTLNQLLLGSTTERTRRGETTITTDLPSSGLTPELADTFNVGLRFNRSLSDRSHLHGSLVAFRKESSDRIERVVVSETTEGNTTTIIRQNQNVGETRTEGLELSLEYTYDDYLVGVTFATTDGERLDTGEELNSVRPDRGTFYVGWQGWGNKVSLRAELESFGSKEEVGENDNVVGNSSDGATVGNIYGAYQVNDNVVVRLRINNITDESYRRFDQIDNSIGRNARLELGVGF